MTVRVYCNVRPKRGTEKDKRPGLPVAVINGRCSACGQPVKATT